MQCNFKIVGAIQTKQRPKASYINGHATVYTPKETITYENYVRSEFQRQCPLTHFGEKPIFATISAYFKPNNELAKYEAYRVACMNHKDLDNIAKIILDSLNGIAYNDDKQIVHLEVHKNYTIDEPEHIEVMLSECKVYNTLDELKREKRIAILAEKYEKLSKKEKLTKAEKERLEKIEADLKEELKHGQI